MGVRDTLTRQGNLFVYRGNFRIVPCDEQFQLRSLRPQLFHLGEVQLRKRAPSAVDFARCLAKRHRIEYGFTQVAKKPFNARQRILQLLELSNSSVCRIEFLDGSPQRLLASFAPKNKVPPLTNKHSARTASFAVLGQPTRGIAQLLGVPDLDDGAILLDEIRTCNGMVSAELMDDRVRWHTTGIGTLKTSFTLDDLTARAP
ncbi:hypothetical protein Y027_5404 [Burkholderia pseudomallei TSV5]|nr:hypothetical protein DO65_5402 [Burkholderia pseudomallei]KGW92985.1 hypothetical protein Y048_4375 [Burkholderia pseudomallei MSHR456]KGX50626.1 hypothetical protein Y027_5404 [Burkholderia pseudomallei TSV5]